MAPVEIDHVPGQQLPHALEERPLARAHQEMKVVRQERPGIHGPRPRPRERREPGHEVGPVLVAPEDRGALDAPAHDVVQGPGGIQPGLSRHGGRLASPTEIVKVS